MEKKYAVRMENAAVSAGRRKILDGVSFSSAPGEFTALIGQNGSGKTTFLKTIMGFHKAGSGLVEVFGMEPKGAAVNEIRKRCGYVPQSFNVDRFFPVLACDVVSLGAGAKQAEETAEELKITQLMKRPFGLLSGGEKQKVLLAMALARKPELLLLDEPNLNLDPVAYRDFLKSVDKIHIKHGLTVIFITHIINQLPESCKRVVVMKEGRIAFESSAKRLLKCKKAPEIIYG